MRAFSRNDSDAISARRNVSPRFERHSWELIAMETKFYGGAKTEWWRMHTARWTSHAYRAFLSRRGAGIATLLYFISNCKKETREWRQKWLTLLASVASFRIPAKVIPAPIVLHLRMLLHLYELLVSRFIHRSRKICWRSSMYPFPRLTFV